jgi:hypothetical protein
MAKWRVLPAVIFRWPKAYLRAASHFPSFFSYSPAQSLSRFMPEIASQWDFFGGQGGHRRWPKGWRCEKKEKGTHLFFEAAYWAPQAYRLVRRKVK